MDRRTFLKAITLPALALSTTGCQAQGNVLRLMALRGSLPLQLPKQFKQDDGATIDLRQVRQLQDIFQQLQQWKRQSIGEIKAPKGIVSFPAPLIGTPAEATVADLATLGDFWLTLAIRQQLLQPMNVEKILAWQTLDPKLKTLLTRNNSGELANSSDGGRVWAIPYRLNSTVLLYRKDIFADRKLALPTDWADLWRSDLKGRISLLDQPREVIGLTLKKLGESYNTENLATIPDLATTLAQLHHNAKFYSSTHYLEPLTLDQTWLAVASSTDALRVMRQNPKMAAVFPKSGSALNADLWVQPAQPEKSDLSETTTSTIAAWCDYTLNPDRAAQFSLLTQGISPSLDQNQTNATPADLRSNPILMPGSEALTKSEFLQPQTEKTIQQWRSVWETMRND
jgi:putative spermidine/putrescine transport system substrate-binding protein